MRRILGIAAALLLLLGLGGCKYMPLPPSMTTPKLQEVQIGGVTYRTGFYEGLDTTLDCVSVTIHGKTDAGDDYSQLEGAPFDLIWTLEYGYYGHGAIYCRADQFEAAAEYYAAPDSFRYSIVCGNLQDAENRTVHLIADMDLAQYDALMAFEADMEWGPALAQNKMPFYEVPLPEDWDTGHFYVCKASQDGYFVRSSGAYRVLNGKLVMEWKYYVDAGTMHVIEVPEGLSAYFAALSQQIGS